jgi:hypothetical protein
LLGILRTLEAAQPGGETGLANVWDAVAGRFLTRRGLVILITDAFDDVNRLRTALRHLRHRGHDILLYHILAPEEIDFPFTRPTRFRDFEQPTRVVPTDSIRDLYRRNFDEWLSGLRKAMTEVQADAVIMRTDEPVDRVIGSYLARRANRR